MAKTRYTPKAYKCTKCGKYICCMYFTGGISEDDTNYTWHCDNLSCDECTLDADLAELSNACTCVIPIKQQQHGNIRTTLYDSAFNAKGELEVVKQQLEEEVIMHTIREQQLLVALDELDKENNRLRKKLGVITKYNSFLQRPKK